jgi:chromate reductase
MISLLIGTNRPGSSSRKIGAELESIYAELGVSLNVIDLAGLPPEIFSTGSYAEKPDSFAPFSQAVLDADGLIVVTPEYNGGMPGVLKYFIDMLPFPESFERRPVCFVGCAAGMWGALRPVEQLQQIFGYRNAHIFPERVFIPGVMGLLGEAGKLTDESIVGRLAEQAKGFLKFVEKLNPGSSHDAA